MRSREAGIRRTDTGDAILFEVRPARPSLSFIAAALLLGGLFGMPALAILFDRSRWDLVSLLAAALGFAVLGVAALAIRRAFTGHAVHRIRLDAGGITAGAGSCPWPMALAIRVELPEANRHEVAAGLRDGHGIGAAIAMRQRARDARVVLDRRGGPGPLPLAAGIDPATAEGLREGLTEAAARFDAAQTGAASLDPAAGPSE